MSTHTEAIAMAVMVYNGGVNMSIFFRRAFYRKAASLVLSVAFLAESALAPVLSFLPQTASAQAVSTVWNQVSTGGLISQKLHYVQSSNSFYGIGSDNAVWKWDNAAKQWSRITDGSIKDDFHFISESDIYAIGMDNQIWRWNGIRWNQVSEGGKIQHKIWYVDGNHIYGIGMDNQVWRYGSAGGWTKITSNGQIKDDFHFVSESEIYGIGTDGQIWKWNGTSWNQHSSGGAIKQRLHVIGSSNIWGIGLDDKIWKWTGGSNWTQVTASGAIKDAFVLVDSSENDIYAIGADNQMWKWSGPSAGPITPPAVDLKINNSDGPITIAGNAVASVTWRIDGFDAASVSCDASGAPADSPFNNNNQLLGGALEIAFPGSVSKYTLRVTCYNGPRGNLTAPSASDSVIVNVGASQQVASGQISQRLRVVSPTLMYGIGLDNKIWKWSDVAGWSQIAGSGQVKDDFTLVNNSENNIYAIGLDNHIWHWNGVSWSKVTLLPGEISKRLVVVSPTLMYGIGLDNKIWKWSDVAGWSQIAGSGQVKDDFTLVNNNENNIYAIGLDNAIWHWNGVSWGRVTMMSGQITQRLHVVSPTLMYGIGLDNKIWKWSDVAGWSQIAGSGQVKDDFTLVNNSENNIYGIGLDNNIWHWNGTNWQSSGAGAPQQIVQPGDYKESITVDGLERTYLLHIPTGYSVSKKYPLVAGFHGGGGTGAKMAQLTGFSEYADKEGFIAVFPDGIKNNWNDGRDTTDAYKAGADDVKFIRTLVERLKGKLPIDNDRIFATGVSNGGIFSHRLACEMSDVFAAIGSDVGAIASNLVSKCNPPKPISVVAIHGTDDPFQPINGGDTKHKILGIGDGGLVESAENTMKFWAGKNNCSNAPKKEALPVTVHDGTSVKKTTNSGCRNNAEVVSYIVNGMGHAWPPKAPKLLAALGGKTSNNIGATKTFWEFFKQHPKETKTPDSPAVFKTIKVSSGDSSLPQGETEIVADDKGHVVVAWMDGSPTQQARMTLRAAYSQDGGKTFSQDSKINKDLVLADPAMGVDRNGNMYLAALRKDSPLAYRDLAVVLFRSFNFGKSWLPQVTVNDDDVFNDRDWLATDDQGKVHITYAPRIPRGDGSKNYDRSVYYTYSSDQGSSFVGRTKVNAINPQDSSGVSSRGVAVDPGGAIFIATQTSPKENADIYGGATGNRGYLYRGKVGQQDFEGPFEFTSADIKIADAKDEYLKTLETPESGIQPFPRMKIYTNSQCRTTAYIVWIGEARDGGNGVYLAKLFSGKTSFEVSRAVSAGPSRMFRQPILTVDPNGSLHIFWVQRLVNSTDQWALFYSRSDNEGDSFSSPQQVSPFTFPIEQWPGDFISATTNDTDVFVAWAAAGGPQKGVYASILRNALSAGKHTCVASTPQVTSSNGKITQRLHVVSPTLMYGIGLDNKIWKWSDVAGWSQIAGSGQVKDDFTLVNNSENNIYGIGLDNNIWHWNGVSWGRVTMMSGQISQRLHVVSPTLMYGIGLDNKIWKWSDVAGWSQIASTGQVKDDFTLVNNQENNIYGIGLDNAIWHWNGNVWQGGGAASQLVGTTTGTTTPPTGVTPTASRPVPTPTTTPMATLTLQREQEKVLPDQPVSFSGTLDSTRVAFPQGTSFFIAIPEKTEIQSLVIDGRTLGAGEFSIQNGGVKIPFSQSLYEGSHSFRIILRNAVSSIPQLDRNVAIWITVVDANNKLLLKGRTASIMVAHLPTEVIGRGFSLSVPDTVTGQVGDMANCCWVSADPRHFPIREFGFGAMDITRGPFFTPNPVPLLPENIAFTLFPSDAAIQKIGLSLNQFSEPLAREFITAYYQYILGRDPSNEEMSRYLPRFIQWRNPLLSLAEVYQRRSDVRQAVLVPRDRNIGGSNSGSPRPSWDKLLEWAALYGWKEEPSLRSFKLQTGPDDGWKNLQQLWDNVAGDPYQENYYETFVSMANKDPFWAIAYLCDASEKSRNPRRSGDLVMVNFESCWKNDPWVRHRAVLVAFPNTAPEFAEDPAFRYPPAQLYYDLLTSPEYASFVQNRFRDNIDSIFRLFFGRPASADDIAWVKNKFLGGEYSFTNPNNQSWGYDHTRSWINDQWEPNGILIASNFVYVDDEEFMKDRRYITDDVYGIRHIPMEIDAVSSRLLEVIERTGRQELYQGDNFKRIIIGLYRLYLRRNPTAAEIDRHRASGKNFGDIEFSLNQSREYGKDPASRDAIRSLYRNYLGKDPSDSEIASWSGKTISAITQSMGKSAEMKTYAQQHPENAYIFPIKKIKIVKCGFFCSVFGKIVGVALNLIPGAGQFLSFAYFGIATGVSGGANITGAKHLGSAMHITLNSISRGFNEAGFNGETFVQWVSIARAMAGQAGGVFSMTSIFENADPTILDGFRTMAVAPQTPQGNAFAQAIQSYPGLASPLGAIVGLFGTRQVVSTGRVAQIDVSGHYGFGATAAPTSATSTAKSSTATAAKAQFTKTLTQGSRGAEVLKLQKLLGEADLTFLPEYQTGYYGAKTTAAVKRFQKRYGLEPVGFVGQKTRALLNSIR